MPFHLRMSGFIFEFKLNELLEENFPEINNLDENKKTNDLTLF